ncbi:hypothetical protein GWN42_32900 [candidate division KSB1 bacterium]|nr:hypothetical protein [candidate division KSB1 bacterium]
MGKALIIIVLGFSTIFTGVMFNMASNQQRSAQSIVRQYDKWIARNAIESVTNVAASKLYQNFAWNAGYNNITFTGAACSVAVVDVTTDSITEAKKNQITTFVSYEDQRDTTAAIFIRPAYSYYRFFLNNWPNSLEYETGDTIVGPVHTNGRIRIKGTPVFIEKVSTADVNFHPVLGGDDPKFYGGIEYGTQTISLPDLTPLETVATTAGGDVYSGEVWLTFNSDGTYDWSSDGVTYATKNLSDYNGTIITTSNNIHISTSTVNGQVTVLAENDIRIEGSIVYNDDPRTNPNSDDYLGLIAKHRLVVADSVATSSGVEIHAAIIAHHDEINVENYNSGSPRGTLTILGSIVENHYLPYGTYSGGVLDHGYEGVHVYDARLRDKTPPYFPRVTTRIEQIFRSH